MGSGKTSIGKRVAKKLDMVFLDMDDFLVKKTGKTVPEIFEKEGEEAFRKYEKEVLHETFTFKNTVIAAGGGTPCFFDNMEQMNNNGTSFYLKNSVDFLIHKLTHAKTERPLVKGKTEEELREYIVKTLQYREQFYMQAHNIINVNSFTKKKSASVIAGFFK